MQRYIALAIAMQADEEALPSFLDVPTLCRPAILTVLREWQEETHKEYPAGRTRKNAVDTLRESKQHIVDGWDVKSNDSAGVRLPEAAPLRPSSSKRLASCLGVRTGTSLMAMSCIEKFSGAKVSADRGAQLRESQTRPGSRMLRLLM
ncbi:hypothetical protein EJ03DRAFT_338644 [Teratosphaeria nubilosa]|uniref:Uncharacterized protein n=1 Tax=Teratosphaeria nubilosa TaxID=161662 RepID=A0A6G1KZM2_9PEZI|nr:hypothetical protein EJ03DRAFT_338644 [Teratosphaeria nubilosa]